MQETAPMSLMTDSDIHLFKEGKHFRLYEKLGSRVVSVDGVKGVLFAVWAPNAKSVSVIGDFNGWNGNKNPLFPRWDSSGIFEGFIPHIGQGALYKYRIVSRERGAVLEKSDPFAFLSEAPPKTASVVTDLSYEWDEEEWEEERRQRNALAAPMSIYEMHLGSFRKNPEEGGRSLTYREMADFLPGYINEMGFTHVQFMPVMEHPFEGSWGYQTVGYFAPTSRFGTPQDFMFLIETLHRSGIGVILDWVPSHFPSDEHGLYRFDGTHLFEHEDPRLGFHPDWKSHIFNYGRHEVRSFLISSALFWLDKYHVDGIRVDAVASMLYLDYSRKEGEWIPNLYGGRENLDAIRMIKDLNEAIYLYYPYAQTIAEESTAWPMVSRPTYLGGLGFGMKWNMGWMHDTLCYFKLDPVHRRYHHNELLFSMIYAYTENFMLPLSHDEVVHGKGSLLAKMPGDDWQKFANLRLLFGYMYTHPGKKLLFMGSEIASFSEWNHSQSLDWHLLQYDRHVGIKRWLMDLNRVYKEEKALFELDFSHEGFEWIDIADSNSSVISFYRKGKNEADSLIAVLNFTPIPRTNYRIGVKEKGYYQEILNSDSTYYGGSDCGNFGGVEAKPIHVHGKEWSISLSLPPLSLILLKRQ
ncbi:1,4-alpha-glucan branching protein GlgB [Estrella lausannensis]|uniref:1,4-alpha-glucan branching enzyme GlgB n=1 Tax=Estrella lausannensis TaxID=483423 RepID=A0A0H5DPA1_9BACT|nr:1,4-alpha-glucan branching protein GlgB [Estrella lausannensis]CRX38222.1 1,4-alpha-glucan branching enzyme [Estrella lausannensis]